MHVTFCPPNTELLPSVISCNYHCHSRHFSILNTLTTLCQASYHEQRVPVKVPLWWAFPFVASPEHGQALPWWWLSSSLSVKRPENSAYYFQITFSTGNCVDSFRRGGFTVLPKPLHHDVVTENSSGILSEPAISGSREIANKATSFGL